jgi:hypothetical protein
MPVNVRHCYKTLLYGYMQNLTICAAEAILSIMLKLCKFDYIAGLNNSYKFVWNNYARGALHIGEIFTKCAISMFDFSFDLAKDHIA